MDDHGRAHTHTHTQRSGRRIGVSADGRHLTRGGEPWLLTADTLWMALTHVPDDEWERYLEQRAEEGFNALLINVLPVVHDMSRPSALLAEPVRGLWQGAPRFGPLTAPYVAHARARLERAVAHGLGLVELGTPCSWPSSDRIERSRHRPPRRAAARTQEGRTR